MGEGQHTVSNARRSPVVGFNHNILHLGWEFHLQTEDSGVQNPHIITHLFHAGTILATKKLVYDASSAPEFVKDLMQAQHKAVLRELKAGGQDERIRALLGDAPKASGDVAEDKLVDDKSGVHPVGPISDDKSAASAGKPAGASSDVPVAASTAQEARALVANTSLEWASLIPGAATGAASAPVHNAFAAVAAASPPPRGSHSPTLPATPVAITQGSTTSPAFPAIQGPPLPSYSSVSTPPPPAPPPPQQPTTPLPSFGPSSIPPPPSSFVNRRDNAPPVQPSGQPAGWGFQHEKTPLPFGNTSQPPAGGSTYFTTQKVQERLFETPAANPPKRSNSEPARRAITALPFDARTPLPNTNHGKEGGAVNVPLPNLEAFLDAYFPGGDCGGILVESGVESDLGSPVSLLLRLDDGGSGQPRVVELKGKVAWRRRRGSGQLKPGTGVEFAAAEKPTVDRLLAEARGNDRPPDRKHAREEMSLNIKIQHGSLTRKEQVNDLSEGGLFIKTSDLISVGEEVTVTLKPPRTLRGLDVKGRVTWHRDGPEPGMGVMFLFDGEDHKEKVEQMVARLIADGL